MSLLGASMSDKSVVILGSGASGVFAAVGLIDRGIRPTIIDVGHTPCMTSRIKNNIYDINDKDVLQKLIIGDSLEGLDNFKYNHHYKSPRLRAPQFKFVTADTDKYLNYCGNNKEIVSSLSMGGLANAWGAGSFRYTSAELAQTPISYEDLRTHYDRVAELVGISGTNNDDLAPFFQTEPNIQDPVNLSKISTQLYTNYNKKKQILNNEGIYVGRARLAAITKKINNRTPVEYLNTEFWDSSNDAIYTPRWTLQQLISSNKVDYIPNIFVSKISEIQNCIELTGTRINTNEEVKIRSENLILATGTLQTSSLLLRSFPEKLPDKLKLLDNFSFQIPFFVPRFFGSQIDKQAFGSADLSIMFEKNKFNHNMQGSIFNITSIPKSEFYDKMPFSSSLNTKLIKSMIPAMGAMFVFVENNGDYYSEVSVDHQTGQTVIHKSSQPPKIDYFHLCVVLQKLGLWTLPQLIQKVPFGGSIHYTGTLPMTNKPNVTERTNVDGTLAFCKRIRIADGSWLPNIPSKHPTYTLMANAHRIGTLLAEEL